MKSNIAPCADDQLFLRQKQPSLNDKAARFLFSVWHVGISVSLIYPEKKLPRKRCLVKRIEALLKSIGKCGIILKKEVVR